MGPLIITQIANFYELFSFFIIFPAIVFIGLYLTIKLRLVQLSKVGLSFSYLIKQDVKSQGSISHYEAISAVLAGNLGTGNISGMAVAITTGGPGALVWMWLMAFLGAVIQYASCFLGVKYRIKNNEGEYVGGPMYYLSKGLGYKKLAVVFSLFAIIGALTVGNFTQINSVTLPLSEISLNPAICSIVLAFLVGIVILGGMHRIAVVASSVVPIMALLYLGAAVLILGMHYDKLLSALTLMFNAAIDNQAVLGGALGFGIVKTITTGFGRGIFATDAGTGLAPMIQSSAITTNPVIDGLVALVPPFLVMIVCTVTGLVLIVTDAWQMPGLNSTNMCTYAFSKGLGSDIGAYVVIISLIMFAYTTILAWGYCAERAIEYIWGRQYIRWFQYLYIALVPVGAFAHVDTVWIIADIAVALMMAINLIGVAMLSREVIAETRLFFREETNEETLEAKII